MHWRIWHTYIHSLQWWAANWLHCIIIFLYQHKRPWHITRWEKNEQPTWPIRFIENSLEWDRPLWISCKLNFMQIIDKKRSKSTFCSIESSAQQNGNCWVSLTPVRMKENRDLYHSISCLPLMQSHFSQLPVWVLFFAFVFSFFFSICFFLPIYWRQTKCIKYTYIFRAHCIGYPFTMYTHIFF